MNISESALTSTLSSQLTAQQDSISQLEEQISSGQSLNLPSDNPAAVTQVLALSSQASQITSWQSNASTASSWLETANGTANSALESMQSAQSLLLQAANQGANDPATYTALGTQLQGIMSNLVSLSNTQYEGRAIFGGTSVSPQAYDAAGNYLGNSDTPSVVIGSGTGSGQSVNLSVTGTTMFGSGAASVFSTLQAAITALNTGTPTSTQISTAMTALSSNVATATQASAVLGSTSKAVANATSSLTSQLTSVQGNQANLEDVNIATATTQLSTEMTTYQAALWAASQSVPETLVKFL
jgi:flagellar hook-associated protein 3 FlgL